MRPTINRWLALPPFQDRNTAHTAALLQSSLLISLAGVITLPIVIIISDSPPGFIISSIFASILLAVISLMVALHKGHVQLVAVCLPAALWLAFTVSMVTFDGIYDSAVTGYFSVIILAALTLGRRGVFIFTGFTIAAITGVYIANSIGAKTIYLQIPSSLINPVLIVISVVSAALLLHIALTRLTEAYNRVRQNEQLLEAQTVTLRQTNTRLEREITSRKQVELALTEAKQALEKTVQERTAELLETNTQLQRQLLEREHAERALRNSEEKYRAVVDNANEAIVVAQDGYLKFFNPKLLEWAGGYTKSEIESIPFAEFIHPDDRAMIVNSHQQRLQGKELPHVYAFRIVNKAGELKWMEINVVPITWEDAPATLFFLNDITERKVAEAQLKESEERYRQLVKYAPAGIYEIDLVKMRMISVNDVMCEYTGYTREEFLKLSPADLLTTEGQAQLLARVNSLLDDGSLVSDTAEYQIKAKNGREFWVLVNSRVVTEEGRPTHVTVVAHDISERKKMDLELAMYRSQLETRVQERTAELTAVNDRLQQEITERTRVEAALKDSHERLLTVLDSIDADIYVADIETYEILFMNKHIQETFGGNLVSKVCWREFRNENGPCSICSNPLLLDAHNQPAGVYIWEGQNPITQQWYINHDRAIQWVDGRLARLQVATDITQLKQAETQIKASLKEKEVLLQEIHHRVKNNMQVISSLLSLQSDYVDNPQLTEAFQDSQNRIRSMAMIHEKLYRSKNLAQIDFAEYIQELAESMFAAQNAAGRRITLECNGQPVLLDIDRAVPSGLIVNELLSNTLKHAFPKDGPGKVRVDLTLHNQQVYLAVSDNGVGFPAQLDFRQTDSLGLQLVNTLVDQIDGSIELHPYDGARFEISFPAHRE